MLTCFSNSRRGAATIQERRLFRSALLEVRRLFESGNESRGASDRANTAICKIANTAPLSTV